MTASSASRGVKATDPRAAAILALSAQATRFPDCLPLELDTSSLDDRDGALAHRIYDVAMRRWHTLEFLLDRHLRQEFRALEPRMRAVLLSGGAQVVFLDRVPTHAAIDESVEWAKRNIRPKAGGMVNAVLRKVASDLGETVDESVDDRRSLPRSDGRFIELREEILPEDDLTRLVINTSMPRWVVDSWCGAFGVERTRILCLHALASPPTIVNTTHATEPVPDDWRAHHIPGHHVATSTEALATRRDLWAQDPSSTASVTLADGLHPNLIVDACAGQGTKTRQLRAKFPEATVLASDTDKARLRGLKSFFKGDERVRVLSPDDLLLEASGKADLVLLDVPCSNSGVLARRVEARYRCGEKQLRRLVDIQRQIMADSTRLLAPKGAMLYATCSVDAIENDAHAPWLDRWHGLHVARSRRTLPEGLPGQDPASWSDGAFAMLLTR